MSILDDIKSLDPNDPGRWPLPVRAGAVALVIEDAGDQLANVGFVVDDEDVRTHG